jgi:AbrB family looped-hinge helix DNA binding protein
MALARSTLTAQGQISVPAKIRKKLGLAPGSVLEWDEKDDGQIVVRRAGKYTTLEIHRALFPDGPPKRRTLEELNEGKRQYIRERYARGRY